MAIATGAKGLGQFWLFAGMSAEDLTWIANLFEEKNLMPGEVLFKQDAVPDALYFVQSGQVAEISRDKTLPKDRQVTFYRVAEAGDLVGRRAVLNNTRHESTASVYQAAALLRLTTRNVRILLGMFPALRARLQYNDIASRLRTIPLFGCFDPGQLAQAVDLVQAVEWGPGEMIYRQGDLTDAMYVIDTGQVMQTSTGLAPGAAAGAPYSLRSGQAAGRAYLAAGHFFGGEGLRHKDPRTATAVAVTPVRLFRISHDALIWLRRLQPGFADVEELPNVAGRLAETSVFGGLTEAERKQLAGFVGLVHYGANQAVFRQGETDQKLYILDEGEAVYYSTDSQGKEQPREQVTPGREFGEGSLFLGEPHSTTIETITASTWLYLGRDDLQRFLRECPGARDRMKLKPVVKERQQLKRYSWLDDDESLLLRERRHWFSLVARAALPLLVVLLGVTFVALPWDRLGTLLDSLDLVLNIAGGIALIVGLPWLAWNLVDWLNDFYIVTTKRVAHIEKVVFISESRDEAPLDKVQDANTERRLLGNLLGFGTLTIDTAAAYGAARLKFDYLAHPEQMREMIFAEMGRARAGVRHGVKQTIRGKLAEQMGVRGQPNVPPVATMPLPPDAERAGGAAAQRPAPPWWNLFWTEYRTTEQVIWRKHWIRLLARVWIPSLVLLALAAAFALALSAGEQVPGFLLISLAGLALPFALWWWWGYANWSNDRYIATRDRLIDLEKLPLGLRTKQAVTTFDKIQNVSFDIPHPLATILDYGTVIIRTAGAEGALTFPFLRHPSHIQAEIFHRLTAFDEAKSRREREERWQDLPDWFSTYEDLRKP